MCYLKSESIATFRSAMRQFSLFIDLFKTVQHSSCTTLGIFLYIHNTYITIVILNYIITYYDTFGIATVHEFLAPYRTIINMEQGSRMEILIRNLWNLEIKYKLHRPREGIKKCMSNIYFELTWIISEYFKIFLITSSWASFVCDFRHNCCGNYNCLWNILIIICIYIYLLYLCNCNLFFLRVLNHFGN